MKKTIKYLIILISIYFITLFFFRLEPISLYFNDYSSSVDPSFMNYEDMQWIKVLTLWSDISYQNWYFHWVWLKLEINKILDYLKNDMLWNDVNFWAPFYSYLQFKSKKYLEYIPDRYIEEIKWIADWAWVSFNDILLLNTYDDILNLSWCSSMIVPRTKWYSNTFYHTRNLDYPIPLLAKYKVLLKYPTHISVWFPWYIWVLTWVWKKWLTLSSHTAYSINAWDYGIPTWFIYRSILENASSLEEAKSYLESSNRTIANNVMVWSYKENKWEVIEFDSKNLDSRRLIYKNIIVSTNHFRTDKMKLYSTNSEWTRYNDYFNKMLNIDRVNLDSLKWVITDYRDTPNWETISNNWTIQSVIMVPQLKKIFIANWNDIPVTRWEYIEFNY